MRWRRLRGQRLNLGAMAVSAGLVLAPAETAHLADSHESIPLNRCVAQSRSLLQQDLHCSCLPLFTLVTVGGGVNGLLQIVSDLYPRILPAWPCLSSSRPAKYLRDTSSSTMTDVALGPSDGAFPV